MGRVEIANAVRSPDRRPVARGAAIRAVARLLIVLGLSVAPALSAQSELVIVKDTAAKEYHRPGCAVVRDGKDVLAMTRAEAESRGFKPHRDCDPAMQAPATQGGAQPSKPKAPDTVYIDSSTKYYHRKTCPKLGTHPEAVAVTSIGKRWPCPACKPPVAKPVADPLVPRWRG